MYITLAICAMLGHALQTALMAGFYRRFDPLSTCAARGMSLGITMLPLLFLAPAGALFQLTGHPFLLLAAALVTAIGNWCAGESYRYMSVGVAAACQQGTMVLTATAIGVFFFSEAISISDAAGILFILLGNIVAVSANAGTTTSKNVGIGALYCVLFGIFLGSGFSLLTKLSRDVDPLCAAYAWEFSTGLVCTAMVLVRNTLQKNTQAKIDFKAFRGILLSASPTAVGTGCYAVAVTLGPIALVTAILSTLVVAAAALSYFLHGERMSRRQIFAVTVVVCAIVLVRL